MLPEIGSFLKNSVWFLTKGGLLGKWGLWFSSGMCDAAACCDKPTLPQLWHLDIFLWELKYLKNVLTVWARSVILVTKRKCRMRLVRETEISDAVLRFIRMVKPYFYGKWDGASEKRRLCKDRNWLLCCLGCISHRKVDSRHASVMDGGAFLWDAI